MFDKLFQRQSIIARHRSAPYASERERYLLHCARRGDSHATLLLKARELLWIARKLHAGRGLRITSEQLRAAARGWGARERACGRKMSHRWARRRFVDVAAAWLRYLGHLHSPVEPIPFEAQLREYCSWARQERGLCETTIQSRYGYVKYFLRWYGTLERSLADVRVNDVDDYLAYGSSHHGWCRITVHNVAEAIRAFFRYARSKGWAHAGLANAIQAPRIYDMETLPAAIPWKDVVGLFATLSDQDPIDVRDTAILMLMAIYGLRASEVTKLRLDHLDWDHDLLHVPRAKRREEQVYPLLPSVGNAIIRYLKKVRPSSAHREVFLTLISPYRPMTRGGLYSVAARRIEALDVRVRHRGPHCLRHACASHLLTSGLSLKQIGDHLGHRSSSATRIYTKVDLPTLRNVAAFDLGDLP